MALESMANFHAQRFSVFRQAIVLAFFAFVTFVTAITFVALLGSSFIAGGMVWMLVVALLSLGSLGYFIYSQRATAQSADYSPTLPFLVMSVILSLLWFTSSISVAAVTTFSYCSASATYGLDSNYYNTLLNSISNTYSNYYNYNYPLTNYVGLCVTGVIADVFGFLSFFGFIVFSLTVFGLGSKSGVWGGMSNTAQMGAVPGLAQPGPGPAFSQGPYGQGPQGAYPLPPQDVYSPQAQPHQQPYTPQMSLQQPYSPQMTQQQPYSPQHPQQQPYSPQMPAQQPYDTQPQTHLYPDSRSQAP